MKARAVANPNLTTQELAWIEEMVAAAPSLGEVRRQELADLLAAQSRSSVPKRPAA